MLGVEPAVGYGLGGAIGATRTMRNREVETCDHAMQMLAWMGMAGFAERESQGLSFRPAASR